MTGEAPYYLAFSYCLGIGPTSFLKLLSHFGDVEKAYKASKKELGEAGMRTTSIDAFLSFRSSFDPQKTLKELQKKQIAVLSQADSRYPEQLRQISDPPICLYVRGDLSQFDFTEDFFFGIVGTRRPSSYGSQITKQFAETVALSGMVVVSGLALGVDAISHKSALEAGGRTIGFLGCGVDIVYPPENEKLYENMVQKNGLVISEFPPGQTVLKGLFVARNRLISGLSSGVLLVEGTKHSGGLITAKYAAEQGKDMFAPPVPLTSSLSEAPNIVLKQGAVLVTSPDDILEHYNIRSKLKSQSSKLHNNLSDQEEKIMKLLEKEAMSADEIALTLSLKVASLLPVISSLELLDIIEKNSEGTYQIKV